jgi:hypothetical protein
MTCSSATLTGNTRKAWVDDARGNTASGNRLKIWECDEANARGAIALGLITA